MNEKEEAIKLAHRLLDEPNADPDDDLRILSRQLLRAREVLPRIIVDLYEMRAQVMPPLQADRSERVQNSFQYQFFTSAIAQLYDKYKVKHEDIEEIIREMSRESISIK